MNTRHSRLEIRGFTLVELMVTVLILSILVGVAVPSYKTSVRKSRRTDAKTALLDLAGREERYFATNNGAYSTSAVALGYSATNANPWPVTVGSGYYQIQQPVVAAATAPVGTTPGTVATFKLTAVPVPGSDQSNDAACASFIIANTGAQTATGTDPNANTDCWN
jgi:type IV pilus assembly protein PilE